jgi:hypothetical protein
MVTPNPAPDSGRPADIEENKKSIANPDADGDQYASGNPEAVTQEDLADSDGAGIRGDYGDAEQTNGLEGGAKASPNRAA